MNSLVLTMIILLSATPVFSPTPGVVINHIPASEGRYVGSPSIAVLPDGTYLATHDEFGPKSEYHGNAVTRVFESKDRGESWGQISKIDGALWSTLFFHKGSLYLIGTNREYGELLIRRSIDGGKTWTNPDGPDTGRLAEGQFHCAPVPVVEHKGRLWRGMEDAEGPGGWGHRFRAFMMSVPVDADLLKAESWTFSNRVGRDPSWLDGKFNGWLEGNAVVTPKGEIIDMLRVDNAPEGETAAILHISKNGKKATFNPKKDFVHFPGGTKKFTIRRDSESGLYWSLANWIPEKHRGANPGKIRNTLALTSSPDLKNWTVRHVVLYHPDVEKHGFQYVDWLFDGKDIIAACRTAFDDDSEGANNMHDANFLTFHRIREFRDLTLQPEWK